MAVSVKGAHFPKDVILMGVRWYTAYPLSTRYVFEAMDRDEFTVVTSMVTLLEVLVHPFRHSDVDLAQQYRDILLNTDHLTTVELSQDIAEEAACLRARHNLRTPDVIQLATAIHANASHFFTNDDRYPSVPGLPMSPG